jgi:hypothetical protein
LFFILSWCISGHQITKLQSAERFANKGMDMNQGFFAVQNTSVVLDKERIKIELAGDPDNAARCVLRVMFDDGSVFEQHFNRNGGFTATRRYDADGIETPAGAPAEASNIALDPADPRNPASRAANDVVNTTSSMQPGAEHTNDHNQALAKAAIASGGDARSSLPDSAHPAKSFEGPQVSASEKPRPDQGVEPPPPADGEPVDHNQALGPGSVRAASAKVGMPAKSDDGYEVDDGKPKVDPQDDD